MALNLSSLNEYVDEQRLPLIRKSVLGARTIAHMELQTGVVGQTALNLLDTTVEFGDGSQCGWDEAGQTTLSQRILNPAMLKVNMSFCDKSMAKYWMNHEVKVAAGRSNLPFAEEFVGSIIENINEKLDSVIWNGISLKDGSEVEKGTDGATHYDGLLDITGVTAATKGATIYASTRAVYNAIPSASLKDSKIFIGIDKYRELAGELTEKNLYHYDPVVDDAFKMILPGTVTEVVGVPGLNGTNKIAAFNTKHTIYGVDMEGDEETFDLWYSKDNQEWRVAINFNEAQQVAYTNELVICDLAETNEGSGETPSEPSAPSEEE